MTPTVFPKLILHFDVNKTLICRDSVSGKTPDEILINQLAEDTVYHWSRRHPPMSYTNYVHSVIVPGEASDPEIKRQRREVISHFLDTVKNYPAITQAVHRRFLRLKEKSVEPIFCSFVKLIERLKALQLTFTIILRTFGKDLLEAQNEILKLTGVEFTRRGKFKEGVLHLKGDENRIIATTAELYQLFAASEEHITIRDSYKEWNSHKEQAQFGKKFVFDNRQATHLSLFFDDNLTGDPVYDIVAPYTPEGDFIPTDNLLNKVLFPVNPGSAILNDNYYITLVNRALEERGLKI